jgi:hypothetical protein
LCWDFLPLMIREVFFFFFFFLNYVLPGARPRQHCMSPRASSPRIYRYMCIVTVSLTFVCVTAIDSIFVDVCLLWWVQQSRIRRARPACCRRCAGCPGAEPRRSRGPRGVRDAWEDDACRGNRKAWQAGQGRRDAARRKCGRGIGPRRGWDGTSNLIFFFFFLFYFRCTFVRLLVVIVCRVD